MLELMPEDNTLTIDRIYIEIVLRLCWIKSAFCQRCTNTAPIREGSEDNSKIIFLISQQKHIVNPHQRHLIEMVLMMGHKICCCFCFHEKKYG